MALKIVGAPPTPKKPMNSTATAVMEPTTEPQTLPMQKVAVVTYPVTELEALTQEYLALYRKFQSVDGKKLVKRMEDIRKQLAAVANETMDEAKPAVFSCPEGELEFSERGKSEEVKDPLMLVHDLTAKFGAEVAFSCVKIGLTQLRQILSDMELKKYLEEQPGHRTLRSVRLTVEG